MRALERLGTVIRETVKAAVFAKPKITRLTHRFFFQYGKLPFSVCLIAHIGGMPAKSDNHNTPRIRMICYVMYTLYNAYVYLPTSSAIYNVHII